MDNEDKTLNNLINLSKLFFNSTNLEEILEDLNYPLEEFLKDDWAIECYKNMGKNTKKYFRPEIVKKLIKYITEEPENDDYLKGHKFPYIACEILKIDCPYVQDLFILTEKEYNQKYNNKININEREEKEPKQNKEREIIIENLEYEGNNKKEKIIKKEIKINNKNLKDKNENEKKEINVFCNFEDNQNKNIKFNKKTKNIIKANDINYECEENKNNKEYQILDSKEQNKNQEKIDSIKENIEQKEQKIVKTEEVEPNNEFLDLLLNFVCSKKKKLNNILCGYFSQVLMVLIEKYSFQILNYLYTVRRDALEQIVNHSYQKSLSLIASKVLKVHDYLLNVVKEIPKKYKSKYLDLYLDFNHYSMNLFIKILNSISLDGMKDEEGIISDNDIENYFSILYDLVDEDLILSAIINNNNIYIYIFDKIQKNIFIRNDKNLKINKNQQTIYIAYIRLVTKIIQNINMTKNINIFFVEDSNILDIIDENNINFYSQIFLSIKYLINNFIDLSSIDDNCPNTLGIHNFYLMDLIIEIFKYMKKAPFSMDILLIEFRFIDKCFKFFFKYQLNNIFHLKFLNFFKLYIENISNHTKLTYHIFYDLKIDEILVDYINQDDEKQNIIEENNNKDKNIENINNLKSYKNKYYFNSKKSIKSGVYPYVVELMYLIQVKCGLKTFDEKEKIKLNIKNLGEFEFVKDENSKNDIKNIEISEILNQKLISSNKWKNTLENKIIPLIKKYEGKLLYENIENIKENDNQQNIKVDEIDEKYNDVNFWEVKPSISSEIKNRIQNLLKKENNSKNEIIDEEDELLGIAMKLEEKKQNKNSKKSSLKKKSKIIKKSKKNKKVSNKNKSTANNKSEEVQNNQTKEENKNEIKLNNKKSSFSKKINKKKVIANFKKPSKTKIKIKLNKNKKDEDREYNDANYWKIKPEALINENEMKDILDDL